MQQPSNFCLILAFGVNPAAFSAFSKILMDCANELSNSMYHLTMGAVPEIQDGHLVPRPYEISGQPFRKGILLAVEIPVDLTAQKECFLDDIIYAFLDTKGAVFCECHTIPAAAFAIARLHTGEGLEPVPRKPIFAAKKLEAKC